MRDGPPPPPNEEENLPLREKLARQSLSGIWQSSKRALGLVWETSRPLTIALAICTVIAGVLPAGIAWVGKELIDAIVAAANGNHDTREVFFWIAVEFGLVVALAANSRLLNTFRTLLRSMLGHRVNVLILEKSLELDLVHFEDSELYDRITRARREASSRPLSLVSRTFELIQNSISLLSYGGLLASFSLWAVLVLFIAAIPGFIAEAKFAGDAFRIFKWRTPEQREQSYLETVISREDHIKEVKLFDLGSRFLNRYISIFKKLWKEESALTWRRNMWALGLGALATAAFYGVYGWIAYDTAQGLLTLGSMTMYLSVFSRGQSTLSSLLSGVSGLYEDNLYLSSLYELLDEPIEKPPGSQTGDGPIPDDGLRFENVSFAYPGASSPALSNVSFHIPAGQKLAIVGENGSGKTTLVKLLARFYLPTEGRITFDGRDLRDWDPEDFRKRIGVIFQDFVRYQMTVGENIGAGDTDGLSDRSRWVEAAEKGLAAPFIDEMPKGYDTQLGRWFRDGRELSGGQWQKIALSRAFMRPDADIVVLDEPTSAMDAAAEAQIFDRFRALTEDQLAIVISHRFSTVRMADQILVLDRGTVLEQGSHEELMTKGGRYATLFELQAAGYR